MTLKGNVFVSIFRDGYISLINQINSGQLDVNHLQD